MSTITLQKESPDNEADVFSNFLYKDDHKLVFAIWAVIGGFACVAFFALLFHALRGGKADSSKAKVGVGVALTASGLFMLLSTIWWTGMYFSCKVLDVDYVHEKLDA